jgi:hypothetical protein
MLDIYICQYCVMFFPHTRSTEFLPTGPEILQYTKFFVGAMNYLADLRWCYETDRERLVVQGRNGARYSCDAFPELLPAEHGPDVHGKAVFGARPEDRLQYLQLCFGFELANRTSKSRRETFAHRLKALAKLCDYIEREPGARAQKLAQWNRVHRVVLQARVWSEGQASVLSALRAATQVADANVARVRSQYLFLQGEPGSGKSEVFVHAAVEAAAADLHVLILCPTGTLVHSYRDRLPASDNIAVDTVHSALAINAASGQGDVAYTPPRRMRRYDLILLDEASQLEDPVTNLLFMCLRELPQV